MGIHLRPGHRVEQGKRGWIPASYDQITQEIRVGSVELGYWGGSIDRSSSASDQYSPIYSIPNPWASAYLFKYVLADNSHPLAEALLVQFLNLLSDFAIDHTVDCVKLTRPEESSQFYRLWKLAPDFIKYGDDLWMFKTTNGGETVGGLSQSSLVWTSQMYNAKRTIGDLEDDKNLISLLKRIHDSEDPRSPTENYNEFWGHTVLDRMLHKAEERNINVSSDKSYPVKWLYRVEIETPISEFYDHESGTFVFDRLSLRSDRQIFAGTPNPQGFVEELLRSGHGDSLPMNRGKKRWVVLDSAFESSWINQRNAKRGKCDSQLNVLGGGFLYPVRPEYIRDHGLRVSDLKIDGEIGVGPNAARADIKWKNKRLVTLNGRSLDDSRSLAIWPPFKSRYVDNYIIEYSLSSITNLLPLEFFDEKGEEISHAAPKHYPGQNFRVYRLSKEKFPYFVRIRVKDGGSEVGGILSVTPRGQGGFQGKIMIGIDFGTSHTSIAYGMDKVTELMTFSKAKPIILTGKDSWSGLIYNFIPNGMTSLKPTSKEECEKLEREPWQPFQTQWMDFSGGNRDLNEQKCLEDGIIPFLHYASDTTDRVIVGDLKWGAPRNIIKYREFFISQLVQMAIVEAEAIGFGDFEIKWSYPRAFSSDLLKFVKGTWDDVGASLGLNNERKNKDAKDSK